MRFFVLELCRLPRLPLILAQILHHKRAHAGDGEKALAGGVDGKAAQIARYPPAVEFFGHGGRGAAAAETI